MNALKHLLVTLAMYGLVLPFLWPLTRLDDPPVSVVTWVLVLISAVANVVVVAYHHAVPAHPKFLVVPWRRAILRVHVFSGTFELVFGLWALLRPGHELAGTAMAVTALLFHAPSALGQTPIVFGSRAIMRPSYLACIGVHVFCAANLLRHPGSTFWVVVTFLVFNVYVWCRIYFYLFDKFGLFPLSKYSVAILAAGLTTIPALLGEATILVLLLAIGSYMLLYSLLFVRSRAEFADFVRERARDNAYREGLRLLWERENGSDDEEAARRFFDHLDRDGDGRLHPREVTEALASTPWSAEILESFLASRQGEELFDFDSFRRHLWPQREFRMIARDAEGALGARSDRDKAELVFRRLDLDGDGVLTRFELDALLDEWAMPKQETDRWLRTLGVEAERGVDFELFRREMRAIWRFIYYDIVEARHGRREDMLARALTAHREGAATRRVERDIRRELVAELSFLRGASSDFLEELAVSLIREHHAAGSCLFEVDHPGDTCWILHRGRVAITLGGEPLGDLGQGSFIGEGALLADRQRGATATVAEDAVMYAMTRASFTYLLERHPTMKSLVQEVHEERRYENMRRALQKELLGRSPFLRDTSETLLEELARALVVRHVDGVVFHEGEPGDCFYLISKGQLLVLRDGELVAELTDGGYFGEGALIGDRPRSATVTTAGPAVLYELDRKTFETVLAKSEEVAESIRQAHRERQQEHVKGLLERGLIRRVPFLRDLDTELLDGLAADLEPLTLGADQIVFREGDEGDALYLIARGGIRIDRSGVTVALLGPGGVFGEAALLLPQRRSATANTVEDSELLRLSRAVLDRMIVAHPAWKEDLEALRRQRASES